VLSRVYTDVNRAPSEKRSGDAITQLTRDRDLPPTSLSLSLSLSLSFCASRPLSGRINPQIPVPRKLLAASSPAPLSRRRAAEEFRAREIERGTSLRGLIRADNFSPFYLSFFFSFFLTNHKFYTIV